MHVLEKSAAHKIAAMTGVIEEFVNPTLGPPRMTELLRQDFLGHQYNCDLEIKCRGGPVFAHSIVYKWNMVSPLEYHPRFKVGEDNGMGGRWNDVMDASNYTVRELEALHHMLYEFPKRPIPPRFAKPLDFSRIKKLAIDLGFQCLVPLIDTFNLPPPPLPEVSSTTRSNSTTDSPLVSPNPPKMESGDSHGEATPGTLENVRMNAGDEGPLSMSPIPHLDTDQDVGDEKVRVRDVAGPSGGVKSDSCPTPEVSGGKNVKQPAKKDNSDQVTTPAGGKVESNHPPTMTEKVHESKNDSVISKTVEVNEAESPVVKQERNKSPSVPRNKSDEVETITLSDEEDESSTEEKKLNAEREKMSCKYLNLVTEEVELLEKRGYGQDMGLKKRFEMFTRIRDWFKGSKLASPVRLEDIDGFRKILQEKECENSRPPPPLKILPSPLILAQKREKATPDEEPEAKKAKVVDNVDELVFPPNKRPGPKSKTMHGTTSVNVADSTSSTSSKRPLTPATETSNPEKVEITPSRSNTRNANTPGPSLSMRKESPAAPSESSLKGGLKVLIRVPSKTPDELQEKSATPEQKQLNKHPEKAVGKSPAHIPQTTSKTKVVMEEKTPPPKASVEKNLKSLLSSKPTSSTRTTTQEKPSSSTDRPSITSLDNRINAQTSKPSKPTDRTGLETRTPSWINQRPVNSNQKVPSNNTNRSPKEGVPPPAHVNPSSDDLRNDQKPCRYCEAPFRYKVPADGKKGPSALQLHEEQKCVMRNAVRKNCQICKQPIPVPRYAQHLAKCMEKEDRRK